MSCFPGWTWEYVDRHMTLPRLMSLQNYWGEHPPIHRMVASYLGYKPRAKLSNKDSTAKADAEVGAFIAASLGANLG